MNTCGVQGHDWLPMPEAPRVLLDGPYAAPAQRWEVRSEQSVSVCKTLTLLRDVLRRKANRDTNTGSSSVGPASYNHLLALRWPALTSPAGL